MTTDTLDPEAFRKECKRRLIDSHDLTQALGLRSRQSLWARVHTGKLPEPILNQASMIALWDRDAIPELA